MYFPYHGQCHVQLKISCTVLKTTLQPEMRFQYEEQKGTEEKFMKISPNQSEKTCVWGSWKLACCLGRSSSIQASDCTWIGKRNVLINVVWMVHLNYTQTDKPHLGLVQMGLDQFGSFFVHAVSTISGYTSERESVINLFVQTQYPMITLDSFERRPTALWTVLTFAWLESAAVF